MENNNVRIRRKVQLREKVREPQQSSPEALVSSQTSEISRNGKSRSWIWILLAVIVLGIIGFAFLYTPDKNVVEPSVIAQQAEVEQNTNALPAEVTNTIPEAITANEEVSQQTETPIQEEVTTTEQQAVANTNNQQLTESAQVTSANVVNVSDDTEAEAMKVIRGDYGIGKKRKELLGEKYRTIQNRVNELKRDGVF